MTDLLYFESKYYLVYYGVHMVRYSYTKYQVNLLQLRKYPN